MTYLHYIPIYISLPIYITLPVYITLPIYLTLHIYIVKRTNDSKIQTISTETTLRLQSKAVILS